MKKFQNKYRIPSARLINWDYANNGAYFITICTQNKKKLFGDIINNEMCLNEKGELAQKFWLEIPIHFPFVELGNFVIMPNHMHGILIINKNAAVFNNYIHNVETLHCNVSTQNNAIPPHKNEQMSSISPKSGSISAIIRSYKSVVSKNIHLFHADFSWQSRFHDHIIRDRQSFETIQNYITNNPLNWNKDKFYGNEK